MSKSTCVRLSSESHRILQRLSKSSGFPITKVVELLYQGLEKKYKIEVLKTK